MADGKISALRDGIPNARAIQALQEIATFGRKMPGHGYSCATIAIEALQEIENDPRWRANWPRRECIFETIGMMDREAISDCLQVLREMRAESEVASKRRPTLLLASGAFAAVAYRLLRGLHSAVAIAAENEPEQTIREFTSDCQFFESAGKFLFPAQGMEAEGGDSEAGSVHDSPPPSGDAPDTSHNQEAG